jgi:hypothetical protein
MDAAHEPDAFVWAQALYYLCCLLACCCVLQAPSGRSRAQAKQHSEQKAELQLALRARFETELWGGAAAFGANTAAAAAEGAVQFAGAASGGAAAAAAVGSGVSVYTIAQVLIEASACYQAVYR